MASTLGTRKDRATIGGEMSVQSFIQVKYIWKDSEVATCFLKDDLPMVN
jgi:hypothetical protein